MYEMFWYWETLTDHKTEGTGPATFTAGADEEIIDKLVASKVAIIDKLEARWADGRAHVAGANITAGDFTLLSQVTSTWDNDHLRNPSVKEKIQAHLANKTHVPRVIEGIKSAVGA